LAELVKPLNRGKSAFVTDFDGTLAPIVNDPAMAAALPESIDALRVLEQHLGLVAVVSGRPVEFLRTRVPLDGVALVGQYGLESFIDGHVVVNEGALQCADRVATAIAQAEHQWPDLPIERKGVIAFTVHWRTNPSAQPDPEALRALADAHDLVLQPGKMACELRPPTEVDKGSAFRTLGQDFAHRAFAGDDAGDVAAFDVRFDGDDPGDTPPIRIAVRSAEAPPELIERADVIVNGPQGLAALLTELAEAVSS
jgi:trehalose 6-phosphate phosphatase